MIRKEKENPKWKEDNICATCKTCGRLYVADKMLRQKFPTKSLSGDVVFGAFHY